MKVVLAAGPSDETEWLAHVLSAAGFSVAVLSDPSPNSPELRGAELLIVDRKGAEALAGSGPSRRLLLAPREGTVDLADIEAGFRDVIALPSPAEEIVARVRHVLGAP